MKKLYTLLLISQFTIINSFGQTPYWKWAKTASTTTAAQNPTKMCTDNFGNVFVLGNNTGNTTYGSTPLDSGSFVVKYDTLGNFKWAKKIEGDPNDITCDDFGNLFIAGNYTGSITIGSDTFTCLGNINSFLIKIKTSGSVQWAKSYNSIQIYTRSVRVDKKGSAYFTGYFYGDSILFGNSIINDTNIGTGPNFFLTKIDSSGTVLWAKGLLNDSINSYYLGSLVRLDKNDNIYVIVSGSTCHYYGCGGYFLIKFDTVGNLTFSLRFWPGSLEISELAFDDSSNVLVSYHVSNQYGTVGTLIKYDSLMNQIWSFNLQNYAYSYNFGPGIPDNAGNIYITGRVGLFDQNVDSVLFNNHWIPVSGRSDVAVMKLNSYNGNIIWIKTAQGDGNEWAYLTSVDKYGNCYIAGNFSYPYYGPPVDTVLFDNNSLISDGSWSQIFVAKIRADNYNNIATSLASEIQNPNTEISFTPNPSSGIFTLHSSSKNCNGRICVYDLLGNCVMNKVCSNDVNVVIDLSAQAKGIYFVKLQTREGIETRKIIIQ